MNTLAERLKHARSLRGFTQADLAKRAGMGQAFVSKLELGTAQKSTSLVGLARALNVNVEWLDTGDGEMEYQPGTVRQLSKQDVLSEAVRTLGNALSRSDKLTRAQAGLVLQALVENPQDADILAGKLIRTLETQDPVQANQRAVGA